MRNGTVWTAILFSALATAGSAAAPVESPAGDAPTGVLAVDCSGSYLRIATEGTASRIEARGRIWEGPGGDELRPAATGRFDGCLVADAVGDRAGRFLYVVVARDPFFGPEATRGYRVAVLRLPDLELTSFVDLDGVSDGPVSLLLSPDGSELLVSYVKGGSPTSGAPEPRLLRVPVADVESRPTLSPEGGRESVDRVAERPLSAGAFWPEEGRILDGPRVLNDRGEVLRRIDPYSAFGRSALDAFPGLVRKGAAGAPYLPIAFADAAANRLVFVVNPDWRTGGGVERGGLVIYDLPSGRTVAIPTEVRVAAFDPVSRGTPTVRLTPDGERVVVETHELRRAPDTKREERFKTGELRVYDAVSGSPSATIALGTAPGFGARVVGFSRDGRLLFYGSRKTVFVVDLVAAEVLAKLDAGVGFDPYWVVSLVQYGG